MGEGVSAADSEMRHAFKCSSIRIRVNDSLDVITGKFVHPVGLHSGRSFRSGDVKGFISNGIRPIARVFRESESIGTPLVLTQGDSEWYRLVKPPLAVGTRYASDRNQGVFLIPKDWVRDSFPNFYPASGDSVTLNTREYDRNTSA